MHNYLYRFLTGPDVGPRHLAVWTIVQLLESGDHRLISNICNSSLIAPHIRELAASGNPAPSSTGGTPHSVESGSDRTDYREDAKWLSRKILEFIDGDVDLSTEIPTAPSQRDAPGSAVVNPAAGHGFDPHQNQQVGTTGYLSNAAFRHCVTLRSVQLIDRP